MRFGSSSRWNTSFELIACSIPSIRGMTGRAPVAIRILSAVTSLPLASLTELGPVSAARSWKIVDLMARQGLGVGALEPPDLGQHIVAKHRPVEALLRHVPAEHRRIVEVLGEMRAIDQQLLGHAAADHAGAADLMLLGDGDARAISRRRRARRARPPTRRRSRTGRSRPSDACPFHQRPRRRIEASSSAPSRELPRDVLAELDPELVERVDPEQHRVGEGPVLVEGDQRAERARRRAGRAGSSRSAGCPNSCAADRRSAGPSSAPRPARTH